MFLEVPGCVQTFIKLASCWDSPVDMASGETRHRNVTEVGVVLSVGPLTSVSSLSVQVTGRTGGDHVDVPHGQQAGDPH